MSVQYGESPAGGLLNTPPTIPNGLVNRAKQIMGTSKQSLKLVPLSGQTTVSNGQKIIVSLPPNRLVDLSAFELNFLPNRNSYQCSKYSPEKLFSEKYCVSH